MDTQMVRTTMYLPVDLVDMVREKVFEEKISMSGFFSEAAREKLGIRKNKSKNKLKLGSYDLKPKFEKFERWMAYE